MENKQFGFNEDTVDERDFTFAGVSNKKVLKEDGQWTPPQFEKQRKSFDTQGCISFGTLNIIEMLHHVQFGFEPNYSDRFLARNSNTTRGGNSPRKVYSALRKQGAVDEQNYPFKATSWNEYYGDVPKKLLVKGEEWASQHSFSYGRVGSSPMEMMSALQYSPLGIGIYAWARNSEGLYYKPNNTRPNHFCVLIGYEKGKHWIVFDTYEESIKKLVWYYNFSYVAGYSLEKKETKIYPTLGQNLWRDFFSYFKFKTI